MSFVPPDWFFVFIGAWLYWLQDRWPKIRIILKNDKQQTSEETKEIHRGLRRELLLEPLLPVPAWASLVLLIFPIFNALGISAKISATFSDSPTIIRALYTILGVISYRFPFKSFREYLTQVALGAVRSAVKELGSRLQNELDSSRQEQSKQLSNGEDKSANKPEEEKSLKD